MKKNKLYSVLKVLFLSSLLPLMFTSCEVLEAVAEVSGITEDGQLNVEKAAELTVTGMNAVSNIATAGEDLSPEVEYTIGRSTAAIILENYKLYDNAEVTEYVNTICRVLTMYSPKPYLYKDYSVAILDTPEINAISTPGGHIFVSKGLLDATNSEDAIAAVLAHEISHIQIGHSSNAIQASRTSQALADGFKEVGHILVEDIEGIDFSKAVTFLADVSNDFVNKIINEGYSQSQEYEADANAIILMQKAGYNPYALLDMLDAIKNDHGGGWGKTHPSATSRYKKAEKALEKGEYSEINMEPREGRFQYYKQVL